MFNKRIYPFLKNLLIIVGFYQVSRLLFYLFNIELFTKITFSQILGGLRFDLAAIGYINLIFCFLYFLPHKLQNSNIYLRIVNWSFYIANTLFITTNLIDIEYYNFTNKRSTFNLITAKGMEQEIPGLINSFIVEYWYIPILIIVNCIIFYFCIYKLKPVSLKNIKPKFIVTTIFIIGIMILFGRGGIQKKPLRLVDANYYANNNNVAVVLNTPFSILKTLNKKENLYNYSYYSNNELNKIFNPIKKIYTNNNPQNKNVVILILESFGKENLNIGQTPFLDSLSTHSLQFTNAFANGRVSIDAVPSIISSIPSLMNNSLISSSFSLNQTYGLPKVLKENNYTTSFFHGAFNGSQNFDTYCKVAGFDKYYGKNEYQGPESFDGKWGVFDEDFLQYFCTEISTFKEPFFTTLFTISSHPPYTLPEKYASKFPKGTNEIHETIAYSDYALKKFFETAKLKPWYNNTLFIITADHTSAVKKEKEFNTVLGQFKIPLLFFDPNDKNLAGINTKNMQQIDIFPSVIDYLGIKTNYISFGKSYTEKNDFVVNYANNMYNYVNGDHFLIFDGQKTVGLYNFKSDVLLSNNLITKEVNIKQKMENFIKAYIQSFNNRMNNNQLTIKQNNYKNNIAKND